MPLIGRKMVASLSDLPQVWNYYQLKPKTDYQLMADMIIWNKKNDPIAASLHTATQQEGKGFFFHFKDRKKGKGEKGDSKDTVETFIDEYANESKRGALYSHETKQEMSFR